MEIIHFPFFGTRTLPPRFGKTELYNGYDIAIRLSGGLSVLGTFGSESYQDGEPLVVMREGNLADDMPLEVCHIKGRKSLEGRKLITSIPLVVDTTEQPHMAVPNTYSVIPLCGTVYAFVHFDYDNHLPGMPVLMEPFFQSDPKDENKVISCSLTSVSLPTESECLEVDPNVEVFPRVRLKGKYYCLGITEMGEIYSFCFAPNGKIARGRVNTGILGRDTWDLILRRDRLVPLKLD